MPFYSYICKNCDHTEDQFRSMASVEPVEQLLECPKCNLEFFHRILHMPNINAGPQSFGTQSEYNFKKYGKPQNIIEAEARKKKADEQLLGNPHEKLRKKLGPNPSKARKLKYIKTGE